MSETNTAVGIESLDKVLGWLDKLQGMSAVALIFLSCIGLGYILRYVKQFPNGGIPLAVVLWGTAAMMIAADARANNMPARVWVVRNAMIGITIGVSAILFHKYILRFAEEWLGKKFPKFGDTMLFKKGASPEAEIKQEPPEK